MGTARHSTIAALSLLVAIPAATAVLAVTASAARAAGIGGVVPDQPTGAPSPRVPRVLGGAALDYQGGPVMHTNRTHIIFWNPSGAFTWDSGYQQLIIKFLTDVQADSHKSTNVYALTGQYYDNTQNPPVRAEYDSTYLGFTDDTDPVPSAGASTPCTMPTVDQGGPGWTTCINGTQMAAEVRNVVIRNGLPTGLTDVYFVVTPNGVGSCFQAGPDNCSLGGSNNNGFCGFHTSLDQDGTHYLYADMPYNDVPPHCRSNGFPLPNGNTADVTISTLSHEHNEAITDPLPGSGTPPNGGPAWQNAGNLENGDLCSGTFGVGLGSTPFGAFNEAIGSGHYFTQEEWSNEDGGCAARDESDTVDFTANAPRPPRTPVTFTSTATDPDGAIADASWDFGDGSAASTGSPTSHVYARTGVYQVTLRTTDIGGQQGSVTKSITVDTAPSASFSAAPSKPIARRAVAFDGSRSTDSDGSIVAYRWAFGDGTRASGAAPSHQYARGGTYVAILTVTDNLGVSSSRTRRITVAPLPRLSTSLNARRLRIVVNEPGSVTIGSTRKRVAHAGAITFKVPLSRGQRARLRAGHRVRLRLRIRFVPRVGPKLTRTVAITIHP